MSTEVIEVPFEDKSLEEAKKVIEAEKLKRAEDCAKEIQEVLKKYNCAFEPRVSVVSN